MESILFQITPLFCNQINWIVILFKFTEKRIPVIKLKRITWQCG